MEVKKLFIVHRFQNADQANAQVERLTDLHPKDSVLLIDDEAEHLASGGAWTQRWLEKISAFGADIGIKIDPDVRVNCAIKAIPPGSDFFGAAQADFDNGLRIWGGAQGITQAAAKAVLDSRMLLDRKYFDEEYTYRWRTVMRPCQDRIVQDIAARLKFKVANWDEVFYHPWRVARHPERFTFVGRG